MVDPKAIQDNVAEAVEGIGEDRLQPFMLDVSGLRGRLVRLGPSLDEVIDRHDYPPPVASLLAEVVLLGTVLAGGLKYDGIFTFQLKGDGPVSMMMMDITSGGELRAYTQLKAEAEIPSEPTLKTLVGKGYLAFTVDQGPDTDRYQGIVELTGDTLSDSVQHYFRQSEQVDTGIAVAVARLEAGWRGGAIVIQRLPDDQAQVLGNRDEDDWRRAMVLLGSATATELYDPSLPPNTLLFRLFHEDGVRVFSPSPIQFKCRCSDERIRRVLASLPPQELVELSIDGEASVTCEFCNTTRTYSIDDIAQFRNQA